MRDDIAIELVYEIRRGYTRLSEDIQKLTRVMETSKMAEREALERLRAAVERNSNLQQSAVTMIQGFAEQIRQTATNAEGGDSEDVSADLNALADQMEQSATAFSEALAANTPAQA